MISCTINGNAITVEENKLSLIHGEKNTCAI